jgi:multidrug efflux pump subunit AcrA (membrane-fusion protein)
VTLRPVQTGNFGKNTVQVTSGLQSGDTIVTAGVQKLREGQKVRLAGEASQ